MGRAGLAALVISGLIGCGAEDSDGMPAPMPNGPMGLGGSGVNGAGLPPGGGVGGGAPTAMAGIGDGGSTAIGGSGVAGAAGMSGMAGSMGMAGSAGMPVDPADLSDVTLEAIGANGTIGLDWTRAPGATGYRLYFSTSPGVTPATGTPIDVPEPGFVHRGLPNGTAHYYVVVALSGGNMGMPSAEATATPHGEWALEQLGNGDFDDVISGDRVPRVPIADRVHILLFAEGYTSADLANFHSDATHMAGMNDVDRWINEIFGLDPYNRFKEAFVVWILPRASAAHAGMGDTAFHVGVSGGGVTDLNAAAPALWDSIDGAGEDAFPYPLAAGHVVNQVASFLIFDSQRGRAGFSGVTTFGLRHPSMQGLSIPAAFGLGQAHEFTHAFGRVSDEYIETSNSAPMRTSETSNVVATSSCTMVPWAHLLQGNGINETADLVGAFGSVERGYHSELQCLMNGTHDNGGFFCAEGDEAYTTLTLRPQRFCNWCRELVAFRTFERTGILTGTTAFDTWKAMYRAPFYDRFGFNVPDVVPQTVQCNRGMMKPVYQACMP